jgi:hypothetical protein
MTMARAGLVSFPTLGNKSEVDDDKNYNDECNVNWGLIQD